jgi:hypothetical protein
VEFVDEEDDLALLFGDIVEQRLHALLELTAKLGAGDQRGHIQRQQAFALDAFRDFAVDDAQGQPFDDGGLADTGLADEDGVVLGTALQHLDGAADFIVATDDRIKLALLGASSQIDRVFL